jgi:hypothetical protein
VRANVVALVQARGCPVVEDAGACVQGVACEGEVARCVFLEDVGAVVVCVEVLRGEEGFETEGVVDGAVAELGGHAFDEGAIVAGEGDLVVCENEAPFGEVAFLEAVWNERVINEHSWGICDTRTYVHARLRQVDFIRVALISGYVSTSVQSPVSTTRWGSRPRVLTPGRP